MPETETPRNEVFELLYKAWVEGNDDPERMVGVQGDDAIVVFVKGGEHYALRVVALELGVAG